MTELQAPTFAPEANMGEPSAEGQQQDYFGFQRTEKFYLPDGISFIEFQAMNEGQKKAYQDKTSKDLVLERSGGARMTILQGSERHELLKTCIVGWNLVRNGKPLPQPNTREGKVALGDFLTLADPRLVEDLEKAIRKANPWLMAEMKSEDIEREIENLQEMLEVAKKREAGEGS